MPERNYFAAFACVPDLKLPLFGFSRELPEYFKLVFNCYRSKQLLDSTTTHREILKTVRAHTRTVSIYLLLLGFNNIIHFFRLSL
jgi:hypothetical protein